MVDALLFEVPPPAHVEIYAGALYADPVAEALRRAGYVVELPLAGLEIGERLQWFAQRRAGASSPVAASKE